MIKNMIKAYVETNLFLNEIIFTNAFTNQVRFSNANYDQQYLKKEEKNNIFRSMWLTFHI